MEFGSERSHSCLNLLSFLTVVHAQGSSHIRGFNLNQRTQLSYQIFLNGGPTFPFTEAISFFVDCKDQAELDGYWEKLLEGGEESQCGWLKDKFGVSWQIVPSVLGEMMSDPDPQRAQRVTEAMLKMIKLDINELKQAYDG